MTQASKLSRRDFIRITAAAGALLAGGGAAHRLAGSQAAARVQATRLVTGSIANLTLISSEPDAARRAIHAAFDRMAELEQVFSRSRPDSQLSRLNAEGRLADPHPAFVAVMRQALAYGELTGGAFDVTIEPVLDLYRTASRSGGLPSESEVQAARSLVDDHQISVTGDMILFLQAGMAVTLDGIAKGTIIDAGTQVLKEHGFDQVMVEVGGDLKTSGTAELRPWQVSIQAPRPEMRGAVAVTQLQASALATSGDYQTTFTPDRRLHHILDPGSGISPGELASASVVAPTASDADALATALLVMGAEAGLGLIERLPAAEALVVTKQQCVLQSSGFPLR